MQRNLLIDAKSRKAKPKPLILADYRDFVGLSDDDWARSLIECVFGVESDYGCGRVRICDPGSTPAVRMHPSNPGAIVERYVISDAAGQRHDCLQITHDDGRPAAAVRLDQFAAEEIPWMRNALDLAIEESAAPNLEPGRENGRSELFALLAVFGMVVLLAVRLVVDLIAPEAVRHTVDLAVGLGIFLLLVVQVCAFLAVSRTWKMV